MGLPDRDDGCAADGGPQGIPVCAHHTDPATLKSSAGVPTMWGALAGLWRCVRANSIGHSVSLPPVGAGQIQRWYEPRHLMLLILLSMLIATRDGEVCKRINIVLHSDLFEKFDLQAIKSDWS